MKAVSDVQSMPPHRSCSFLVLSLIPHPCLLLYPLFRCHSPLYCPLRSPFSSPSSSSLSLFSYLVFWKGRLKKILPEERVLKKINRESGTRKGGYSRRILTEESLREGLKEKKYIKKDVKI